MSVLPQRTAVIVFLRLCVFLSSLVRAVTATRASTLALIFPPALAGRALSAYKRMIFAGVFVVQRGIGLAMDLFRGLGLSDVSSLRAAMAVFWVCNVLTYTWYVLRVPRHNVTLNATP